MVKSNYSLAITLIPNPTRTQITLNLLNRLFLMPVMFALVVLVAFLGMAWGTLKTLYTYPAYMVWPSSAKLSRVRLIPNDQEEEVQ